MAPAPVVDANQVQTRVLAVPQTLDLRNLAAVANAVPTPQQAAATESDGYARFKEASGVIRDAVSGMRSLFTDRSAMLRSESSLAAQLQLDALLAGIVGLQYPSDGQARGELASRTDVASVLDFVKTTFAKDASGKFTNPNMTLANASQVLQDAASKLGLRLESRTVDGRATVVAIRR